MRKTKTHFEQIPVGIVKTMVEQAAATTPALPPLPKKSPRPRGPRLRNSHDRKRS